MHPSNQSSSSSSGASSGATPRSDAIVRLPSRSTSDTTTPLRPVGGGPRTSTARRKRSASATSPDGVRAALPDEPRLRAERGRPGGDVRRLPAAGHTRLRAGVVPVREGLGELDDDVQQKVSEGTDDHF